MYVDKQIDDKLKHREDLIRIRDASADYLAALDTDPDSQARADWRLWSGPNGEPVIGLGLHDQEYRLSQQFSPIQLEPANIRELRLIGLWNKVLRARARREIAHVDELLRQYQGD